MTTARARRGTVTKLAICGECSEPVQQGPTDKDWVHAGTSQRECNAPAAQPEPDEDDLLGDVHFPAGDPIVAKTVEKLYGDHDLL